MPNIKILTERDLRELVPLDLSTLECIEKGFVALAGGKVIMPPILSMGIHDHNGEVDVKTAYVPSIDSFAIKMSPGYFDNPKLGLPSTSGLMVLFSAKTGVLKALLLDNGYLTDTRTAAAGAVAANHLARLEATKVCMIGTGVQARLQLKALTLVRNITSAKIWGRDKVKAKAIAIEMTKELNLPVNACPDVESAVATADIIVTTTPSTKPLIKAGWLCPGQHVTAIGSDQDHKCELDPACIGRADLYVPDRQSQTERLGELRSAIAAGIIPSNRTFTELGHIAAGKVPGRQDNGEITIADLTGTGVQDTAIATHAYGKALKKDLGTDFIN